jgi:hypothetical protein
MSARSYELHGIRIFECAAEGAQPRTDRDAVDLISAASSQHASLIVLPAERLGDDVFHLKTRIAGEILQKLLTYGMCVAIVGDISLKLNESSSLRDFVYECNHGPNIWFVANLEELENRLKQSH